jgi:hypothetical protein
MKIKNLNKLNDYINYFLEKIEKGADILSGEVPKIVTEVLKYEAIKSGISAISWAVVLCLCYLGYNKALEYMKREEIDSADAPVWLPPLLPIIPAIFFLYESLFTFLKIMFAPRIFIIEYLKEFIK